MALPSRRHALERLLRQLEEEGIAALGQYWADAEVTGFLREYLSREDAALLQIEVDFALPDARFRERGPLPSGWRGSERLLAAFHSIGVSWGESHSHRILLATACIYCSHCTPHFPRRHAFASVNSTSPVRDQKKEPSPSVPGGMLFHTPTRARMTRSFVMNHQVISAASTLKAPTARM